MGTTTAGTHAATNQSGGESPNRTLRKPFRSENCSTIVCFYATKYKRSPLDPHATKMETRGIVRLWFRA